MRVEGFSTGNDLFGNKRFVVTKSRQTERGELLRFFSFKTGMTIARVAFILTAVPTADLYVLQKQCEGARNFTAFFKWATNPKKHI